MFNENLNKVVKRFFRGLSNEVNNVDLNKALKELRENQLKQFSIKELMDELRRRGKTVSKKGVR